MVTAPRVAFAAVIAVAALSGAGMAWAGLTSILFASWAWFAPLPEHAVEIAFYPMVGGLLAGFWLGLLLATVAGLLWLGGRR